MYRLEAVVIFLALSIYLFDFFPQAKHPTPCRISTVGFQALASKPDVHVSAYPALH
jgi:hypothetical protein